MRVFFIIAFALLSEARQHCTAAGNRPNSTVTCADDHSSEAMRSVSGRVLTRDCLSVKNVRIAVVGYQGCDVVTDTDGAFSFAVPGHASVKLEVDAPGQGAFKVRFDARESHMDVLVGSRTRERRAVLDEEVAILSSLPEQYQSHDDKRPWFNDEWLKRRGWNADDAQWLRRRRRDGDKRMWDDASLGYIKRDASKRMWGDATLGYIKRDAEKRMWKDANLGFVKRDVDKRMWKDANLGFVKKNDDKRMWQDAGLGFVKKNGDKRMWGDASLGFVKKNDDKRMWQDANLGFVKKNDDKRMWGDANLGFVKKNDDKRMWGDANLGFVKKDNDKRLWGDANVDYVKKSEDKRISQDASSIKNDEGYFMGPGA